MSILSALLGPRAVAGAATESPERALLIGSADAVRDIRRMLRRDATTRRRIIGALLTQPQRRAGMVGVRVLGLADRLGPVLRHHDIQAAYVSVPAAMNGLTQRLTAQLQQHEVTVHLVPTVVDQLAGHAWRYPGPIDPAALLDRPPRPLDEQAIAAVLRGKRVMITGAGGSIGSQIAHIVARFAPAELQLMERAENNLFEIDHQLAAEYPQLHRRALLHDVTDARRTRDLTRQHRPHVIFHTAAHKHVPMMEDHPRQAVENNLFGTKAITDAAIDCNAERFVMISTDKAVNPSSVMGATKRLAELYVQHRAASDPGPGDTRLSIVRFGNVLGSACSVVPIWSRQLHQGQALTVTDPKMTRYFMTIPEAAALVIQAASLQAPGGSVFLLDMGQPVRIIDLAERFVRLHGLEPGRDVPILYTGSRPGEKLHEELAYGQEQMTATSHPAVRMLKTAAPPADVMEGVLRAFERLRQVDDAATVIAAIRHAVPRCSADATASPPAPVAHLHDLRDRPLSKSA